MLKKFRNQANMILKHQVTFVTRKIEKKHRKHINSAKKKKKDGWCKISRSYKIIVKVIFFGNK